MTNYNYMFSKSWRDYQSGLDAKKDLAFTLSFICVMIAVVLFS